MFCCTCRVCSAQVEGAEYRKSTIVICHIEDGMPVFGEIIDVIIAPLRDCLLVMHPLIPDHFDRHFHSYHVFPSMDHVLVYHHFQLHDYQVLHTNHIHDKQ